MLQIQLIGQVLSALLTPIIALIAVYIAWQQWKTNQRKLNFDLYDRRLRVYQGVRDLIDKICRSVEPGYEDFANFNTDVAEADFLFGPEIRAYLTEIRSHAAELRRWSNKYRHESQNLEGSDHAKLVENEHLELIWFIEQIDVAREKFGGYLRFGK